ncbi:hypothetical protein WISP_37072 [Willisornis vidua]|uniref:Uncharacterized protein n=1 Tax=Willisornis vidua TaxID=1566151 RepID=A0ABQ9DMP9_9PASS|nr:hypothetical protein WISP_37072 [Willisornis vidua]
MFEDESKINFYLSLTVGVAIQQFNSDLSFTEIRQIIGPEFLTTHIPDTMLKYTGSLSAQQNIWNNSHGISRKYQEKPTNSIEQGQTPDYLEEYQILSLVLLVLLDPYKSIRPGQIHPSILKELADIITKTPPMIFEWSWESSKVPADWKLENVPVFKKGKKDNPRNCQSDFSACLRSTCLYYVVMNKTSRKLQMNPKSLRTCLTVAASYDEKKGQKPKPTNQAKNTKNGIIKGNSGWQGPGEVSSASCSQKQAQLQGSDLIAHPFTQTGSENYKGGKKLLSHPALAPPLALTHQHIIPPRL